VAAAAEADNDDAGGTTATLNTPTPSTIECLLVSCRL